MISDKEKLITINEKLKGSLVKYRRGIDNWCIGVILKISFKQNIVNIYMFNVTHNRREPEWSLLALETETLITTEKLVSEDLEVIL